MSQQKWMKTSSESTEPPSRQECVFVWVRMSNNGSLSCMVPRKSCALHAGGIINESGASENGGSCSAMHSDSISVCNDPYKLSQAFYRLLPHGISVTLSLMHSHPRSRVFGRDRSRGRKSKSCSIRLCLISYTFVWITTITRRLKRTWFRKRSHYSYMEHSSHENTNTSCTLLQ